MDFIIEFVIYLIIILFPILFNLFFIAYKKNIKGKEKNIFLNLSLLISLYLSIKYFNMLENDFYYIFSTIPILLSFLYKKPFTSIILISIFIENYLPIFNNNFTMIVFILIFYYTLYLIFATTDMSKKSYAITFSIISSFLSFMDYYIYNISISLDIFIIFFVYYISVYLSVYFILWSKEVIYIFMSFKDLEKEKFIKLSLFKITHEIKNPLAVVKGYLDMFDPANEIKSKKYINIIKNEVKRTLNLLNDLNDFNKIKITKTNVSFNKLLDEVKEIFIPYFKENKVHFSFKTEDNIIICIDKERIKQVLMNVLKNSVEASETGCKINFSSYTDSGKLYIYIKDNASGMSKEVLENLFTPFYTTKEYGTGLGLPLSKEIIEAHNGIINYTSIIGSGTTVKIVIPFN